MFQNRLASVTAEDLTDGRENHFRNFYVFVPALCLSHINAIKAAKSAVVQSAKV